MKKNNMLRIASVLLVAVLLSTCAISGAFAKYTTSGTASDEARVAAFGVTVTVTDADAFKTQYDAETAGYTLAAKSSTSDNIVAPGTTGSFGTYSLSGTTEVAVEVVTKATVDLGDKWMVDGATFYCPITFSYNGNSVEGSTFDDVSELEDAVAALFTKTTAYEPGVTLSADATFSWTWDFEVDNAKDTKLGQLTGADVPTIDVAVSIAVNQIN